MSETTKKRPAKKSAAKAEETESASAIEKQRENLRESRGQYDEITGQFGNMATDFNVHIQKNYPVRRMPRRGSLSAYNEKIKQHLEFMKLLKSVLATDPNTSISSIVDKFPRVHNYVTMALREGGWVENGGFGENNWKSPVEPNIKAAELLYEVCLSLQRRNVFLRKTKKKEEKKEAERLRKMEEVRMQAVDKLKKNGGGENVRRVVPGETLQIKETYSMSGEKKEEKKVETPQSLPTSDYGLTITLPKEPITLNIFGLPLKLTFKVSE